MSAPDPRLRVRPMTVADHPAVLALNEDSVAVLSPLDGPRLAWIAGLASAPLVVVDPAGAIAGFAIALPEGTAYDSDHYRWFAERYERFLYLDRIAVAAGARRRGVGSLLYDAAERIALPHGRMLCEVDSDPVNPPSLAFHRDRGYVELERRTGASGKGVAMFAKELGAG
ncbi:acetyltransferase GNAT family [Patulibacter medicamentivorans]|uniref:Acetyltransferase GNAT family n=1 Tax=Patulibacter medicamentivorans TaxID=1097667 RepID=H0E263_9ACTN|nr:GNAT family N-acetyltransferase [Patulibacter medicamentivorans]EHN12200.1 acetyltransferase GNAT family [Patulibacter medicamentivorans]